MGLPLLLPPGLSVVADGPQQQQQQGKVSVLSPEGVLLNEILLPAPQLTGITIR